jgi:hypothetical protein
VQHPGKLYFSQTRFASHKHFDFIGQRHSANLAVPWDHRDNHLHLAHRVGERAARAAPQANVNPRLSWNAPPMSSQVERPSVPSAAFPGAFGSWDPRQDPSCLGSFLH